MRLTLKPLAYYWPDLENIYSAGCLTGNGGYVTCTCLCECGLIIDRVEHSRGVPVHVESLVVKPGTQQLWLPSLTMRDDGHQANSSGHSC